MYYVYELQNPKTQEPFYVGKGSGSRHDWHTKTVLAGRDTGNPYKDRVITQILREGNAPVVSLVYKTECEQDAYDKEEQLIKEYGMRWNKTGILTNLVENAKPPNLTGHPCSEERREKIRQKALGKNNGMYGKKHSEETKAKMSKARSGENNPMYGRTGEDHPLTGYMHTKKEKARRSKYMKELMKCPVRRAAISKNRANDWKLIDPEGNTIMVTNLMKYCKDNNLLFSTVRREQRGWKCQQI